MKLSGQHPREYLEASFDIISASNSDCLPEIEILSVMNDVINSFNELSSQNYVLVINNSFLLNAILDHCRIAEFDQKKVYYLLSEYNNKLIKSSNATRENRAEWLNGRLPHLNMNESTIEKLLNFLLKSGGSEKILSEMKTLTKSDNNWSKLAKEAIRQMKLILDNIKIMDIKIPIVFSPAFVLPVILHPSDYSGFIFQLQVRRKNKNEFDILASGGRYDSLISKFANRPTNNQRAVGISFDFEKIVSLISEKSGHKFFRSEVVVCSIGDIITNQSNIIQSNSTNSINSLVKSKKNTIKQETSVVSTSMLESKNKLRLYKQLLLLNSNFGISTHMIHEKFSNTEEMDDYCKKACINSYSYINDNSVLLNSKIVANNQPSLNSLVSDSNAMEPTETSASSKIFLSIRSWIDRGFRFMEKEFNLNDFMAQSNQIINSISSIGSTNFANSNLQLISSPIANSLLGSGGLNTTRRVSSSSNQSYMDLVNSMLSPQSSSLNPLVSSSPAVPTSSASATNLNCMSQLNVTLLLEPANRQQTNSNVNRKKLEQQVIGKLGQVFSIFSARTRIDLVVIETHENVIQILANHLHLEQDKTCFHNNWNICMEKINNKKLSRQLNNFRLGEILYELRYVKKSKVFIIYGYKSDQYKLLVAA
ncbi:Eukaryotic translation initiation factor 2-alpha kinase 4 [Brachionus plicatilis]|uniref:Eukaryotic translation initiation factor 2-alpha kinase 4 n=1 Tax=Brachionus plicatilis TaxID=10195 RepID=A0A3M7PLJ0_BRAPC|nr:Eukaryotic translation initiation factor 2-alpha kinase 4 [Brachionus plicatilis]